MRKMHFNLTIIVVAIVAAFVGSSSTYYWVKNNFTAVPSVPSGPYVDTAKDERDMINKLLGNFFRVLYTQKNPFDESLLIVATESEKVSSETNDGCGGLYVSPTCYFFIKPNNPMHNEPPIEFVGFYRGDVASLGLGSSLVFKNKELLEFNVAGGDAGSGVEAVYTLDLRTSELKKIREEYISTEE